MTKVSAARCVRCPSRERSGSTASRCLPDENGAERMIAHYMRLKELGKMLEHGIVGLGREIASISQAKAIRSRKTVAMPARPCVSLEGFDAATARISAFRRCPSPRSACAPIGNRSSIPTLTKPSPALSPGSRYREESRPKSNAGRTASSFTAGSGTPIRPAAAEEQELIAAGKIRPEEARHLPVDIDGGKPVRLHLGSIAWNEYRKKWILIAVESGGTSMLGEVWFSEAESPVGPWRTAKKIVTHDKYSFYNPVHHPFFDQEGGRVIYFEGTYSSTFSGNTNPTPRYDYNQIMYRLDLGDPRLAKPHR